MLAMLYALFTFHWRAASIRKRGQAGFDDRYGPTVLAIVLLAAVVVNLVLRLGNFAIDKDGKGHAGRNATGQQIVM
jgi:hypothetical protein